MLVLPFIFHLKSDKFIACMQHSGVSMYIFIIPWSNSLKEGEAEKRYEKRSKFITYEIRLGSFLNACIEIRNANNIFKRKNLYRNEKVLFFCWIFSTHEWNLLLLQQGHWFIVQSLRLAAARMHYIRHQVLSLLHRFWLLGFNNWINNSNEWWIFIKI